MKSVFWDIRTRGSFANACSLGNKTSVPPGEEEFRSKVLSCEAPSWGPAPYLSFYFFWEKRYPWRPLHSTFNWQMVPLSNTYNCSLELCITFSCCKCTIVKLWINQKTRKLSRLFHRHKILLLAPLGPFTDQNDTDFPTLSYTSTIEILTHSYTWSLEKVPLSQFGRSFPV